jgi:hypothetical protein
VRENLIECTLEFISCGISVKKRTARIACNFSVKRLFFCILPLAVGRRRGPTSSNGCWDHVSAAAARLPTAFPQGWATESARENCNLVMVACLDMRISFVFEGTRGAEQNLPEFHTPNSVAQIYDTTRAVWPWLTAASSHWKSSNRIQFHELIAVNNGARVLVCDLRGSPAPTSRWWRLGCWQCGMVRGRNFGCNFGLGASSGPLTSKIGGELPTKAYLANVQNWPRCRRSEIWV